MTEASSLQGTVKPYRRHLFLCTGKADWPARLDEVDGLVGWVAVDIRSGKDRRPFGTKVAAVDQAPRRQETLDLIVFPERLLVTGLDQSTWAAHREVLLGSDRIPSELVTEPLEGQHLFVCVHGERDERCGRCGPPLVDRLRSAIDDREATEGIFVHSTSHVGGHRYAGNVLSFPPGDWYGTVTPADVDELLEAVESGSIVERLWRG